MLPDYLLRRPDSLEILAMPLCAYDGDIHLVRSPGEWSRALDDLSEEKVLGFDTETRPTFRRGLVNDPALVQLATAKAVYLVQLADYPFGPELAAILSSPEQIKTGVAIKDDMQALARIHPFEPAGLVDLGQVAKRHGMPNHGLRTLAASLFGQRISKGSQCSNWSAKRLSPRQISYAATDAWISRRIYMRMKELGLLETVDE